jgi:hypothetical protein
MVDGGRQVGIGDHRLGGGGAGGGDRGGGHGEQALADIGHLAVGEQLVVVDHRADVVLAGDVLGGQHQHHAGRGAHGRQVHRTIRRGPSCSAQMDVQHAGRLGHVVDIDRRARDVAQGAVMRQRGVDAGEGVGSTGTVAAESAMSALPPDTGLEVGPGGLDEHLAQHIAGRQGAIGGRGAGVAQRREVAGQAPRRPR